MLSSSMIPRRRPRLPRAPFAKGCPARRDAPAPILSCPADPFLLISSVQDLTPFLSVSSTLFCTTGAPQPFWNQFVLHSFYRYGGCTPSHSIFIPQAAHSLSPVEAIFTYSPRNAPRSGAVSPLEAILTDTARVTPLEAHSYEKEGG